jgi:hypothetical protein
VTPRWQQRGVYDFSHFAAFKAGNTLSIAKTSQPQRFDTVMSHNRFYGCLSGRRDCGARLRCYTSHPRFVIFTAQYLRK